MLASACGGRVALLEPGLGVVAAGGAGGFGSDGRPATDARDCTPPTEAITSSRAIELSRCLPETADADRVVWLLSDSSGRLDELGRSPSWRIIWVNEARRHFETVLVSITEGIYSYNHGDSDELTYLNGALPAPSEQVIADAESRYRPLDPIAVEGYHGRFYEQNADCAEVTDPAPVHQVLYCHQDLQSGEAASFQVRYTWDGTLVALCGPCRGSFVHCCDIP